MLQNTLTSNDPHDASDYRPIECFSTVVMTNIIAHVYRLSAVHCQMTRYSQRVPGYLIRYSVSATETSFDKKKSANQIVSFK